MIGSQSRCYRAQRPRYSSLFFYSLVHVSLYDGGEKAALDQQWPCTACRCVDSSFQSTQSDGDPSRILVCSASDYVSHVCWTSLIALTLVSTHVGKCAQVAPFVLFQHEMRPSVVALPRNNPESVALKRPN